jgi:CBS domain-containing protein
MTRNEAVFFADQLRNARESALKDAEAFDGIIHVIERLGTFCTKKISNLGGYEYELAKLAEVSDLAEEIPRQFRDILTPWTQLYNSVKVARNDALHQGASARHLTVHAIELSLILEDALRDYKKRVLTDYMVRNPICAEGWQPIAFIRQQMLAGSFSFLPFLNADNEWRLLSDQDIAIYLGEGDRKERMALALVSIPELAGRPVYLLKEETSINEALTFMKKNGSPVLVENAHDPMRLLGIVTAFDLL